MEEQLIEFQTAVLAKEKEFNILIEKGFDKNKSIVSFGKKKDHHVTNSIFYSNENLPYTENNPHFPQTFICTAPTQSLLQKWLREVHKIDVIVIHQFYQEDYSSVGYDVCITTSIDNTDSEKYCNYGFSIIYKTYEEALEKGLFEALKLIKIV